MLPLVEKLRKKEWCVLGQGGMEGLFWKRGVYGEKNGGKIGPGSRKDLSIARRGVVPGPGRWKRSYGTNQKKDGESEQGGRSICDA